MRNINDYTKTYMQSGFESIQVKYRCKKFWNKLISLSLKEYKKSNTYKDIILDRFFSLADNLSEFGSEIYANCKIL